MTWTSLTFAYGSTLTSSKMTQLYDNLTAMAEQASGAPNVYTGILMAEVATTSGTTADFTIPSWAKKMRVMLKGVSFTSTSPTVLIRLGDAGGIETTGYVTRTTDISGTESVVAFVADDADVGMLLCDSVADSGQSHIGIIELTLQKASTYTWFYNSYVVVGTSISNYLTTTGCGYKSTSAQMTTLRVCVEGSHIFDAGAISVMYE